MKDYVEQHDGGYWIAGKRVSLDSIVYAFWQGQSPESIQQSFPTVTLEEVYGAIAFYLSHRPEVDESIAEDEIEFERMVAESRKKDPVWYEKMERAREEMLVSKR